MNRIRLLVIAATLASLNWVAPVRAGQPSAAAVSPQKPSREQPSQPPASSNSGSAQQPDQPKMGSPGEKDQRQTVMLTGQTQQQNGEYVLSDSGVSYKLDPQDKAKRFAGQEVKVTGTLDMASNVVHVTEIQPA